MTIRQKVLVLYLATSALDAPVIGWAAYDGTGASRPTTGDSDEPPYATGVAALLDGWRLIQAAPLLPPYPGREHEVSYLKHEFLFERLVSVDGAVTSIDVTASRTATAGTTS